jgi:hypothetical protein
VATPSGPAGPLGVETFSVASSDAERSHAMTWDVEGAWEQDGFVVMNVRTHGIEGGGFRFRLVARAEASRMLAHAPGAQEPSSFDFSYAEVLRRPPPRARRDGRRLVLCDPRAP